MDGFQSQPVISDQDKIVDDAEDEGKEKAGVGDLINGGTYLRYAVSLELVVQKINSQNKDSQDEKRRQIA